MRAPGRGATGGLALVVAFALAGFPAPAPAGEPSAAPAGAARFVAFGNEPGWRLIIEGGAMTLNADYGALELTVPAGAPTPVAGGRSYAGASGGRALRVTVLDSICHDTMTGMPRPNSVEVEFDNRKLAGCGGEPVSLLRGAWVVERVGDAPALADASPTLLFQDDGAVSGTASCNRYTGSYALSGEGLAVSRLASTRMACPPPQQEQEDAFLALLREVIGFERPPDGSLLLHTRGGRTVRARRAE